MKSVRLLTIFLFCSFAAIAEQKPNVVIKGKLVNAKDDPIVIAENDTYVFQKAEVYRFTVNPDSTFEVRFYLPTARPIKIDNQTVFATPGDSIFVTLTGKGNYPKMAFEGPRSYQYSYFPGYKEIFAARKAEDALIPQYGNTPENLLPFKDWQYKLFLTKNKKLDDYCTQYNCSAGFKNYAYAELYYEYLNRLLAQYTTVNKQTVVDEQLRGKYFEGINPARMQNDKFTSSLRYNDCLESYVAELFVTPNARGNDPCIAQTINYITAQFNGNTRDLLMGHFFVWWFNKGDQKYKDELLTTYAKAQKQFSNQYYIDQLAPFYSKYSSYGFNLNQDNLTNITSIDNKTQTLASLINSYKGNLVYIDIWASWCARCRAGIPHSEDLAINFKDKNVKVIYLSVDKDKEAWKKAFKEMHMDNATSFLIDKDYTSNLATRVAVSSIPRYVLVGKTGNIEIATAPRPVDNNVQVVLNNMLASKE